MASAQAPRRAGPRHSAATLRAERSCGNLIGGCLSVSLAIDELVHGGVVDHLRDVCLRRELPEIGEVCIDVSARRET
jgi:hypothetical protein